MLKKLEFHRKLALILSWAILLSALFDLEFTKTRCYNRKSLIGSSLAFCVLRSLLEFLSSFIRIFEWKIILETHFYSTNLLTKKSKAEFTYHHNFGILNPLCWQAYIFLFYEYNDSNWLFNTCVKWGEWCIIFNKCPNYWSCSTILLLIYLDIVSFKYMNEKLYF